MQQLLICRDWLILLFLPVPPVAGTSRAGRRWSEGVLYWKSYAAWKNHHRQLENESADSKRSGEIVSRGSEKYSGLKKDRSGHLPPFYLLGSTEKVFPQNF